MKFLTDRHDIANEINIKETPVVMINIAKCMDGWEHCYEGDKIVVNDIRCTVKMYGDGGNENLHGTPYLYNNIELMPENICITDGFGRKDVIEDVEWRKAVRAREGEDIIVVFDTGKTVFVRKMKIGKVTKWVYPAATLQDID